MRLFCTQAITTFGFRWLFNITISAPPRSPLSPLRVFFRSRLWFLCYSWCFSLSSFLIASVNSVCCWVQGKWWLLVFQFCLLKTGVMSPKLSSVGSETEATFRFAKAYPAGHWTPRTRVVFWVTEMMWEPWGWFVLSVHCLRGQLLPVCQTRGTAPASECVNKTDSTDGKRHKASVVLRLRHFPGTSVSGMAERTFRLSVVFTFSSVLHCSDITTYSHTLSTTIALDLVFHRLPSHPTPQFCSGIDWPQAIGNMHSLSLKGTWQEPLGKTFIPASGLMELTAAGHSQELEWCQHKTLPWPPLCMTFPYSVPVGWQYSCALECRLPENSPGPSKRWPHFLVPRQRD